MEFKDYLQVLNQFGSRDETEENGHVIRIGLTKKKNGENIDLIEFYDCVTELSSELKNVEDVVTKDVIRNGMDRYSIDCVNLFRKLGDQGSFSFMQIICGMNGNQTGYELRAALFQRRIVVVKTGVLQGGFYSIAEDVKKGSPLINEIRKQSTRKQRVIASERYGPTGKESFSFCLMEGVDGDGKIIYHVVQVRALFHIQVDGTWEPQACVRYMDVVKPLDVIEEHLRCVCLRWSTDDETDYTNGKNKVDERIPPAPWFDVVPFSRLVSVVQVIRQRYNLKSSDCNPHWATWRYCLNRFKQVGEVID